MEEQTPNHPEPTPQELTPAQQNKANLAHIYEEMGKVVVGQQYMVSRLLIGLLTEGHILLEGVPGLAKTLTVSTLSKVLGLKFQRIQFTPDLLPSDVVGTMIYNQREGNFEVRKGPVFANLILADEINRSPAKVQAALLESMQEKQVTIGETSHALDKPFLVMATQNPVEQEGTYPLPEAQVDRFMLKIFVNYPTKTEELQIMRRMSNPAFSANIEKVLSRDDIMNMRNEVNQVAINSSLEEYIIELIFATRYPTDYGLEEEARYIQFGASPRASINLSRAAKALAYLNGIDYVMPEHVKEVAVDVLNHRIQLNYEAEADGITSHQIIEKILNKVPLNQ